MNPENIDQSPGFEECSSCAAKIIYWCIAGNVLLAFVKLLAGVLSHSSGLVADGMQSSACVVGCIVIMYSVNVSKQRTDARFPYGYGKVEFIVSLAVFSVLFGLGLFLFVCGALFALRREFPNPSIAGLPVAVLSVALTYLMYKSSLCAGRKLNSAGMMANAYQSKADMLSSCGVCIGIVMAQFSEGLRVCDLLAVFLVGALIMKDSFHHWARNLEVLVGAGIKADWRKKLHRALSEVVPSEAVRTVKMRRTGNDFWVGVGIVLPDGDKIEEWEVIERRITELLRKRFNWVERVDVFLDVPPG
jgi:cation diffusion facilitator family transporter